ncbi:hypothetical protein BASA82_000895 [Batrachochytrium salamandrivorans]|uniref:Eukaryotic translation initiation factor 3 subunit K n=1 Tax=Batrachochytrium salamandrivorans TaxID=1357716 RepID=A0ABQ8FGV3_9FUNG|nr:hypothetical protein BASA60_007726 [Batrachochytrium salamandrivorans]KAH6576779.1 hypothetical protein BASA62_001230 [Batrachochytrium salamandrivorans]KAH6593150.1 hypothetical protein BASA61_004357 [Batrachochytrium salamandrivorans]KAH6597963.1 hypothetical protein BASA50_004117 [Batrachochytrium salamandrivorans]KAH9257237.1 hypothetical protein BASA81_004628 [Batrachochytrium salamandrivorans]
MPSTHTDQAAAIEDEVAALRASIAARPEYRPEEIHLVVETVDRYNPQNMPILEEYVTTQLKTNNYDRTACLALLKLYQLNHADCNVYVVASVLALALGVLPESDFTLCLCLLREEWLADPLIAHLVYMHDLLEQARFAEFWKYLEEEESVRDFTSDYSLFDDNVREFIAQTLSITYQTIAIVCLEEMLDLTDDDLADWVKMREGWTVNTEDDSLIDLPITSWNQAKEVVMQEDVKFEQLGKLLGRSRLAL